jgi:hypothetical protein
MWRCENVGNVEMWRWRDEVQVAHGIMKIEEGNKW